MHFSDEKEKVEHIIFRVQKGEKAKIKEFAASCGESLNGFITRAIAEATENKSGKRTL